MTEENTQLEARPPAPKTILDRLEEALGHTLSCPGLTCPAEQCVKARSYTNSDGSPVDVTTRPAKHLVAMKKSLVDRWARARVALEVGLGDRLDNGAEEFVDVIPPRPDQMFPILRLINRTLDLRGEEYALSRARSALVSQAADAVSDSEEN